MYTQEQIYDRIKNQLVDLFEIDEAVISMDAHLSNDLDLDSIDAVDLLAEMRDVTQRKIEPTEFKSVQTIGDVVSVLHRIVNE